MTQDRGSPTTTVVIPTHDHPSTLDLAVASVLDQSVASLELVVIGDGVGDDTRDVMAAIDDPRVRFVDTPKSASRAEPVRHGVLSGAASDYVCYLGDDDLMLPGHVATMVEVLQSVDFVHPLPVYLLPEEGFGVHLADLSLPECREWHLHPARNAVSLTGVAHRLDAYRRLPFGWREPPAGRWSDHYMWQQWFHTPGFRYRTHPQLTVLKFDSSVRRHRSPEDRRAEMLSWIERSGEEGFSDWLQRRATAALLETATGLVITADHVAEVREDERDNRLATERELNRHRDLVRDLDDALAGAESLAADHLHRAMAAESDCAAVKATRTWRTHDRIIGSAAWRRLSR